RLPGATPGRHGCDADQHLLVPTLRVATRGGAALRGGPRHPLAIRCSSAFRVGVSPTRQRGPGPGRPPSLARRANTNPMKSALTPPRFGGKKGRPAEGRDTLVQAGEAGVAGVAADVAGVDLLEDDGDLVDPEAVVE